MSRDYPLKNPEDRIRAMVSWREGVSWVKTLSRGGKQSIVVAVFCNTQKIRALITKRFPGRNRTPAINGIPIIVEYLPL